MGRGDGGIAAGRDRVLASGGRSGRSVASAPCGLVLATLFLFFPATIGLAQEDTVEVVAGPRYRATELQRWLMGAAYRELWTAPIRVPLLRPDTFAGGLTILQRGSSLQTISLRLQDAEGAEWVFRSVDKEQSEGLPRDLQNTVVETVAQDLVAGKHPGAALVVAPLLEAAGILHATPRLVVMADHSTLGEHRDRFAGMLGYLEERPNEIEEPEEERGYWGYPRIIGSERLLERLRESSLDRVDARAFLAARLVDLLVGDWDRHPDQWRWAEDERGGTRYWLPIPRDRDNAFPNVHGAVPRLAEALRPTVRRFEGEVTDLYQLIHNAQPLDRPLLAELTLATWDSVATALVRNIDDAAIANAVSALPPEWQRIGGADLTEKLRSRRDALPHVARSLYALMVTEVEVVATNESDRALIERLENGSLRVRLQPVGVGAEPYFDRLFLPSETREVRVWLLGGEDHATVLGSGVGVGVRVIGGEGADQLEDRSARGPTLTAFFDDSPATLFVRGSGTRIDRRTYRAIASDFPPEGNPPPPRDWGSKSSLFGVTADWRSDYGPVIGGGPSYTRYGFRRLPYAEKFSADLLYAPLETRFGIAAGGRILRTGGGGETRFEFHAWQLESTRFHGYGNESADLSSKVGRIRGSDYHLSAEIRRGPEGRFQVGFGPTIRYLVPEVPEGNPGAELDDVVGTRAFGAAGMAASLDADFRNDTEFPTSGLRAELVLSGHPLVWGQARGGFATGRGVASAYLPIPGLSGWSVAARLGGEHVWGAAPLQYAAAVGGSALRGYRSRRFTGDSAVFGGAELRARLGRANLLLLRGEIGVLGLIDFGRVYASGEHSDRWHRGRGAGVWFAAFERDLVVHALWARGEKDTLKVGLGMPF